MLSLAKGQSYWSRFASLYALLDSPLRPCQVDVRTMERAVDDWSAAHPDVEPRALVLGVTPALALMRWPAGTAVIGADSSYRTVRAIWPGDDAERRFGICADWRDLPFPPASFDIAMGDGALNCVSYPCGAHAVCRSVVSALSADGRFIVRCYIRPEIPEEPELVFAEMFRAAIPTFSQFKFRLFLAMAGDAERGVPVAEVYRLWASYSIDAARLSALTGWPVGEIETMNAYRGSSTVHSYPNLAEFRAMFAEFFDEVSSATQAYPLGENCRIFVLRPREEWKR